MGPNNTVTGLFCISPPVTNSSQVSLLLQAVYACFEGLIVKGLMFRVCWASQ